MPVVPTRITATGDVETYCEVCGATGLAAAAAVQFGRLPDGGVDPRYVRVPCSACGAVTIHPVGGGSHPVEVQRMCLELIRVRAGELGIPKAQRTREAVTARVRAMVNEMDGPERWQMEDAP